MHKEVQRPRKPCGLSEFCANVRNNEKVGNARKKNVEPFLPDLISASSLQLEVSPEGARLEIKLPLIDAHSVRVLRYIGVGRHS